MHAAAFLGRLAGTMLDPLIFIPVLAIVWSLRARPIWARLAISACVPAAIAAAFVLALPHYGEGMTPVLFYFVGGFVWALILIGIGNMRMMLRRSANQDSSN
jgi:hypothetical protein